MIQQPHIGYELELWEKGYLVCGVDEVGRGSFAGPLVVGAVVLKPIEKKSDLKKLLSLGINDSKLVSIDKREEITKTAQKYILFSTVQYISVGIINRKGVGFANRYGFEMVAKNTLLSLQNEKIFFLSDAFKIPKIKKSVQKNIIRGDSISISIALASIIAKVERDNYMKRQAFEFPSYSFEKHKGYGTLLHRNRIKEYGICELHRTSFVQNHI